MIAAAKKYDPKQIFQKIVPGGFKVSKVAQPYAELSQRRRTAEREEL